jgi:hypothetical protein
VVDNDHAIARCVDIELDSVGAGVECRSKGQK